MAIKTVEALTYLGMGRLDDGDFVPRVLPGEQIEMAENGQIRIVLPSSDRVAAPCAHYKSCGGCSVMHGSDTFVAQWKTGIIESALLARGIEAKILPIITSPPHSRRRAKYSGRRTKKGAIVGFHARGSDAVINAVNCQVVAPEFSHILPLLESITRVAASRKSEIQFTVIQSKNGPDVWVEADRSLDDGLIAELVDDATKLGLARLTWNDEPVATLEKPFVSFGAVNVVPPPGAFLQPTLEGEKTMVAAVRRALGDAKNVIDLFSGCGTFTFPMAVECEVHAVEGERSLIAALDAAWRDAKGLKAVTSEVRDLFRRPLEQDELDRFDAAIIDPPRAGADAQIQCLSRSKVGKMAMVSCNPVTFARDAQTLIASGYSLDWVLPIDQFRWSSHVELVSSFTRL